jgi:hypothetical protein
MKRTKGGLGGGDDARMSYTNLAALASEFENSASRSVLGAFSSKAGSDGASQSQPPEKLYQKAMELINMGLKLDMNNPLQANENYQQGAELLSQALERAQPGSDTDEMQRTLDMVEEHIRLISREAVGRSHSDSQITTDQPTSPGSPRVAEAELKPTSGPDSERASNYFDRAQPARRLRSLPPPAQLARRLRRPPLAGSSDKCSRLPSGVRRRTAACGVAMG